MVHDSAGDEEGTYAQRVRRIFDMMDVRTAFTTEAELARAVQTVKDAEAGKLAVSPDALQAARKIVNAIIHPDTGVCTGEKVFMPLRLSFIVPCNLVLDTLMMSARGTPQVVAAQTLNQTYNALHYRANRNATAAAEDGWQIAQAYVGATASSVAAALGVERWASRAPPGAAWAPYARRLGPFAAVAAADVLNVSLMRRSEFTSGVLVRAPDGTPLGQSPTAGAMAVGTCIAGRVFAAAPVLTVPPLLLHAAEKWWPGLQASPARATAALMAMVAVAIQVSVPLTFGIFKQTASCPSAWLEDEIASKAPGQRVTYNKGL